MKKRLITELLAIATAGLCAYSVYTWMGRDQTAPVITIPTENIVYQQGQGMDSLLQGVTAVDETDGDLTDQVGIGLIAPSQDKTQAEVEYLVFDSSGNLGKAVRTVSYLPKSEEAQDVQTDVPQETTPSADVDGAAPVS